ncbi:MAG: DUF5058 family protein [Lachnospiraceae bacterium]|nr:DUF5058 family protein [Lachnospiraceae bacterium]MDY6333975.1 DUF5058 family protein [Lachnospiraceae bacterium]
MLQELNSPVLYLICGAIILFVAVTCIIFMVRAYRAGKAIGMDPARLRRVVTSSMTFSFLPSVGILLGVIALSGSLGTPWPWLRLSVIGALHYETQVAEAAAEAVGIGRLSAENMTPRAFSTIALLMSVCIMWGMVLSLFFNKRYTSRLQSRESEEKDPEQNEGESRKTTRKKAAGAGFADTAMTAMFIGLISAYLGSYIGGFVSGNGKFAFRGDITPIVVCLVSCVVMGLLTAIAERKHQLWLESFSIALSMFAGMTAAVLL